MGGGRPHAVKSYFIVNHPHFTGLARSADLTGQVCSPLQPSQERCDVPVGSGADLETWRSIGSSAAEGRYLKYLPPRRNGIH